MMIEKVAKALWAARGGAEPFHFASGHWTALAKEAIAAMREPSADMALAMLDQLEPGSIPRSMPVSRMFTAAINAALTEGEG